MGIHKLIKNIPKSKKFSKLDSLQGSNSETTQERRVCSVVARVKTHGLVWVEVDYHARLGKELVDWEEQLDSFRCWLAR